MLNFLQITSFSSISLKRQCHITWWGIMFGLRCWLQQKQFDTDFYLISNLFRNLEYSFVPFIVTIFTFLTNIALSFIISDYLKSRIGLVFRNNVKFTFFQAAVQQSFPSVCVCVMPAISVAPDSVLVRDVSGVDMQQNFTLKPVTPDH